MDYLNNLDLSKLKFHGDSPSIMITRFPPEPSGYLHIGHVKALLINYLYAKKYNGNMIIRIDDTNPEKSKKKYVLQILQDIYLLGISSKSVSYTSSYFDTLLDYAELLLDDGLAYVDNTSPEEVKLQREQKINSKNRNNTPEQNKTIWNLMKKGHISVDGYCLRLKIHMSHKNIIMRDPIIYRINRTYSHYKTERKYNVYPAYDFACPIVDSLEGITHAFRNVEYTERRELYKYILKLLKLRIVIVKEYQKLDFRYTVISKRKIQWLIDNNYIDGWNDPRTVTLRGLIRRGMTLNTMIQYLCNQIICSDVFKGSYANSGWAKLWSLNNKNLHSSTNRYFAISNDNIVVNLTDLDKTPISKIRPLNPKNIEQGYVKTSGSNCILIERSDALTLKQDEEFTFLMWGNACIKSIDIDNNIITATSNFNGDFTKTKKLSFVDSYNFKKCEMIYFDHILTTPSIDEKGLSNCINSNSRSVIKGMIEYNCIVKEGDIIQIIRRGFAYVEKVTPDLITLHMVPSGKESMISNVTLPSFNLN